MIVGDVIHNVTKSLQCERNCKIEADRVAKATREAQEAKSKRNVHLVNIADLERCAINAMNKGWLREGLLSAIRAEIKENPLGTLTIPLFTRPVKIKLFTISENLSYGEIFENSKVKDLVKFIESEGLKVSLRQLGPLSDISPPQALEAIVPRKTVIAIRKSIRT